MAYSYDVITTNANENRHHKPRLVTLQNYSFPVSTPVSRSLSHNNFENCFTPTKTLSGCCLAYDTIRVRRQRKSGKFNFLKTAVKHSLLTNDAQVCLVQGNRFQICQRDDRDRRKWLRKFPGDLTKLYNKVSFNYSTE